MHAVATKLKISPKAPYNFYCLKEMYSTKRRGLFSPFYKYQEELLVEVLGFKGKNALLFRGEKMDIYNFGLLAFNMASITLPSIVLAIKFNFLILSRYTILKNSYSYLNNPWLLVWNFIIQFILLYTIHILFNI